MKHWVKLLVNTQLIHQRSNSWTWLAAFLHWLYCIKGALIQSIIWRLTIWPIESPYRTPLTLQYTPFPCYDKHQLFLLGISLILDILQSRENSSNHKKYKYVYMVKRSNISNSNLLPIHYIYWPFKRIWNVALDTSHSFFLLKVLPKI